MDKITSSDEFLFNVTLKCYCNNVIDVKYSDDEDNIRQTICANCGYNHIDLIFETRKEMERLSRHFLNTQY